MAAPTWRNTFASFHWATKPGSHSSPNQIGVISASGIQIFSYICGATVQLLQTSQYDPCTSHSNLTQTSAFVG